MSILDGGDFVSYGDIKDSRAIFKTVTLLIKKFNQYSTIPVIFDKSIRSINPLLFILLLAQKRSNVNYIIDVTQLSDYEQARVQHFLRQNLENIAKNKKNEKLL